MEYSSVQYVRTPTTIVHSNKRFNILHVKFNNTELNHMFYRQMRLKVYSNGLLQHTHKKQSETLKYSSYYGSAIPHPTVRRLHAIYGMMTWSFTSQYNARIDRVVQSQTLLKEGQHKGLNRIGIGCLMSELLMCTYRCNVFREFYTYR
eukprot:748711_1